VPKTFGGYLTLLKFQLDIKITEQSTTHTLFAVHTAAAVFERLQSVLSVDGESETKGMIWS